MNITARIAPLVVLLVASCASGPAEHTLYFLGEEALNPNSSGTNTPVNVRVYQLTDKTKFQDANFDALWRQESAVLGDTLVDAVGAVITTTPDEIQFPLIIGETVHYIGIVGLFNREQGPWKMCVAVDEVEDWRFRFREYQILQEKR